MPNKTIVAMACVTAIIVTCVFRNIDGALVGSGIAVLAGLGGYVAGKTRKP